MSIQPNCCNVSAGGATTSAGAGCDARHFWMVDDIADIAPGNMAWTMPSNRATTMMLPVASEALQGVWLGIGKEKWAAQCLVCAACGAQGTAAECRWCTLRVCAACINTRGVCEACYPWRDLYSETLCKTGSMVLDSFFDLFAGADDKDKNALLQNHTGCAAVLPWMSLEGHAGTAWRELEWQLGVQKQTPIASAPGALLPQSSRSLKRVLMETGRDEDGRT
jgi:hypothetical protein